MTTIRNTAPAPRVASKAAPTAAPTTTSARMAADAVSVSRARASENAEPKPKKSSMPTWGELGMAFGLFGGVMGFAGVMTFVNASGLLGLGLGAPAGFAVLAALVGVGWFIKKGLDK